MRFELLSEGIENFEANILGCSGCRFGIAHSSIDPRFHHDEKVKTTWIAPILISQISLFPRRDCALNAETQDQVFPFARYFIRYEQPNFRELSIRNIGFAAAINVPLFISERMESNSTSKICVS